MTDILTDDDNNSTYSCSIKRNDSFVMVEKPEVVAIDDDEEEEDVKIKQSVLVVTSRSKDEHFSKAVIMNLERPRTEEMKSKFIELFINGIVLISDELICGAGGIEVMHTATVVRKL